MSILGCLDRPSRGEYRLGGALVAALDDHALSRLRNRTIGFVFQSFHLIPQLTVLENVETPLLYGDVPPAAVARARPALPGAAWAWSTAPTTGPPSCRAARRSARPSRARWSRSRRMLLADEPTGNLDTATGEEIAGLLAELHGEGRTVIVVTHNEALAAPRRAAWCACATAASSPRSGDDRAAASLLRLGLRSLLLHKLRSTLSILGVVFGVARGDGHVLGRRGRAARGAGADRRAGHRQRHLARAPGREPDAAAGVGLRLRDAEAVRRVVPHLLAVAPVREAALLAPSADAPLRRRGGGHHARPTRRPRACACPPAVS